MPFWWRRRRRYWFTNNKRFRRRKRKYPFRRRRFYKRRRTTKLNRRRRRRHRKVRKKKQTITVKQWQPDSIRRCKIKGIDIAVLGAEGTQFNCYTTVRNDYVQPKVPYGGGFGVQNFTLRYLYEEYTLHNNIWTATNIQKELCRYLRCRLTFFRHPNQDFIVAYSRQPPHNIDKYTFPSTHPHQMLLDKRKKIILSQQSKQNGKYFVTMNIKPPKQMLTKWFFSKNFAPQSLFLLKSTVANFRYSHLSGKNQNLLVNITSLNPGFYHNGNWAQVSTKYLPYSTISLPLTYKYKDKTGTEKTGQLNPTTYNESVNITKGFFSQPFLFATQVLTPQLHPTATIPLVGGRYNPTIDDGVGNQIYLHSILTESWPPKEDKSLIIEGLPLWLGLWGYLTFVRTIKNIDYLRSSVVVLKSKYIYIYPQQGAGTYYIPLDMDYIQGKKPYDLPISESEKNRWYPDTTWQTKSLNAIVESGPYVPKLSDETYSTWELKFKYCFYFKWGGSHLPEEPVKDPNALDTYNVPDTLKKTIQIINPEKQTTESIIHPWDLRRGLIKETALKRMCDHLETDSEFEPITEDHPKKKKRKGAALQNPEEETQEIQNCLQNLCEQSTLQEQPEDLQQLIIKQQQYQQTLKYNILKLIFDLKEKQKQLQLQTGLLE
nr:MAG: ORF1 [Torque teno midi virus]